MPLVSRTRATLRSAEFGFFGVVVYTRVHTPRRWGAPFRAGVLPLDGLETRPFLTSCWMVGTAVGLSVSSAGCDSATGGSREQSMRAADRRKTACEPTTTGPASASAGCGDGEHLILVAARRGPRVG